MRRGHLTMAVALGGLGLASLVGLTAQSTAQEAVPEAHEAQPPPEPAPEPAPERKKPWDPEVIKLFSTIPVQHNGRVKPLDTYAGFMLLKLNGKRTLEVERKDGRIEKLKPVAWLLDCLFFPEQARQYDHFLVQNSEVLTAAGLEAKAKRDRYSFDHLEPALKPKGKLRELVEVYQVKKAKDRTPVETQTLELWSNANEFYGLTHFLDFARPIPGKTLPPQMRDKGMSGVLNELLPEAAQTVRDPKADRRDRMRAYFLLYGFRQLVLHLSQNSSFVALFAPSIPIDEDVDETKEWLSAWDVAKERLDRLAPAPRFKATKDMPEPQFVELHLAELAKDGPREPGVHGDMKRQIEMLGHLERLEAKKNDQEAFKEELEELHSGLTDLADDRGEYDKIPLEVTFYKADFFTKALVFYILSFLLVALSWMMPDSRLHQDDGWAKLTRGLNIGIWVVLGVATLLLITGVTFRCVIRSRPPVTTLYETILFITGCAVLVAMVVEWINRQRIAIATATILGAAGMFLANRYEFREAVQAGDTMGSMQAVLDTNFWLATHVTTVTLGYAAGLLAAALAHVWILGKLFGFWKGERALYRSIARMVYGIICFGLLFSVVGTILGGIWANYSWGRFWGWDPKENGALLICLWELVIIHARLGGYIRDHGMCVMAILGGMVVVFSWWGVNLLGVGLHSYGFTDGVWAKLMIFYGAETLVVLASGAWLLGQSQQSAAAKAT